MRFVHMADCHIGVWRDPELRDFSLRAFRKAIDFSVENKVDFVLIAGDLFNTSLPPIDALKDTVKEFRRLQHASIPVYMIAGSHDYSPSGKTMIDVLEEAGLVTNVCKGSVVDGKLRLSFTQDKKTGIKITGMLGRRGMLDKQYYEALDIPALEQEQGEKVFLFHTALTELKPKEMEQSDSSPLSLLPKGFDYYAGGHVHIVEDRQFAGYAHVVYPGPLFPANFAEMEKLRRGGFVFYDEGRVEQIPLELIPVLSFAVDCTLKTATEATQQIAQAMGQQDVAGAIVLLRISGTLVSGKPSDIAFPVLLDELKQRGAFFVLRNTSKLTAQEFEEVKVIVGSVDDIEQSVVEEQSQDSELFTKQQEKEAIKDLLQLLTQEKDPDGKVAGFEDTLMKDVKERMRL
ncbi:exonuclease SbcCD subunit D [Candidatus Woesearchaeota archaeon]|nr:exonuclease SbcCD subunit D [Candidatus Woesearchaeota archaeon]